MSDKNRLLVIWDELLAGTLNRHARGKVVFQYSQDWLNNIERPISLSLPCMEESFPPGVSTAFFENLLPESNARAVLAFNCRFDKKDTFAFLENFGHDCAGALSIIPENEETDFTPGQYERVDTELLAALDKIKADPAKYSLFPEMRKARLSIAGAQDKLPVYLDGQDQFYLPATSGSATTHIIKPVNNSFPDIPKNEAFCMALARHSGLSTPDSKLMKIGDHELFVVARYDRSRSSDNVRRIHQEDFCQAVGVPADKKYQENGGPGFLQCRQLIDEHLIVQGVETRIDFVKAMIFNYIIGNHDAHGKNFSIIHGQNLRLAPFYDLVSTQVYPLVNKFAMAIGNTFRHDRIKESSFIEFARHMNFRAEKIADLMEKMFLSVNKSYVSLLTEHEKKYGTAKIYNDLSKVIKENLKQLSRLYDF